MTQLYSDKLAVSAFNSHKTSGDHDGRYYTETEINAKLSPLYKSVNASTTAAERNFVLSDYQNVHVVVASTGINFIFPNKNLNAIVIVNAGINENQNGIIFVTARNEHLVFTTVKSCDSSISVAKAGFTLGITFKNVTGIASCIM